MWDKRDCEGELVIAFSFYGGVCFLSSCTMGLGLVYLLLITFSPIQIIHFPPGQRPRAVLFLDPSPSSSSAITGGLSRVPISPRPDTPGSYAHPRKEQQPASYAVTTVAWAPSCGRSYHLIATGGRDGRVRLWKVRPPEKKDSDVDDDGEGGGDEVITPWSASIVADFDEHKSAIGKVAWNVTG